MAQVIITESLERKINKIFKKESVKVIELILSLEASPKKGKSLSQVGGVVIKEIKYKSYRLYFITDGYKIKFLDSSELTDLIIKFVDISDKRSQQKTIDKIKKVLRLIGEEGFV